jgi:hypothetical protein
MKKIKYSKRYDSSDNGRNTIVLMTSIMVVCAMCVFGIMKYMHVRGYLCLVMLGIF